jgi:hypothetical protein
MTNSRYASFDEYGLRHLPCHLIRSERLRDLVEKLTNFDFLEAKCQRASVYEMLADYQAGLQVLPDGVNTIPKEFIRAISIMVREQSHNLILWPELTKQQIIPLIERWFQRYADSRGGEQNEKGSENSGTVQQGGMLADFGLGFFNCSFNGNISCPAIHSLRNRTTGRQ